LTTEEIEVIKGKGSVVIHGVVDTKTASGWKTELEEFIKANPHVEGQFLYTRQPMCSLTFFMSFFVQASPNIISSSSTSSQSYCYHCRVSYSMTP